MESALQVERKGFRVGKPSGNETEGLAWDNLTLQQAEM